MNKFDKLYSMLTKNNDIQVYKNYCTKSLTTFKIGGVVRLYIVVNSSLALLQVIKLCDLLGIKWFCIGKGSNLLISDKKLNMAFISLGTKFMQVSVKDDYLVCGGAVSLFLLNKIAADNNLSGLEWSYGIPGSLAGAVVMNAGCFGGEISYVIHSVTYTDGYKEYTKFNNALEFGYRTSFFKDKKYIITKVVLKLTRVNNVDIFKHCLDNFNKKKSLQPYEYPSAGSVFKRVDNCPVPILIEKSNLKGLKIGDAQVSTKHCGFIVNLQNAKSKQVFKIICKIKKTIYKKFGIILHNEIICVGDKDGFFR